MKSTNTITAENRIPEREILQAVKELRFGVVEVVVHEARVTEIRQTKRLRISSPETGVAFSDLKSGG